MEKEKDWGIMIPWNAGLIVQRFDRRIEPRDFLYGSEIGKSFLEVYWAMNGVEPTNLASDIARRKMEAGNFYEALVVWVLRRVGLLKETQTNVRLSNDPRYLDVHGRLDIVAGHDGNWNKTYKELEHLFSKLDGRLEADQDVVIEMFNEAGYEFDLDRYKIFQMGMKFSRVEGFDFPFFNVVKKVSYETVDYLKNKYPNGLEDQIYEVKSINSMAFWRNNEPIRTPYKHHIRQLTFYQMYHPVKKGSFLYIDRDTMSISELPNMIKDDDVKEIYEWLEKMTYYYRNKKEPPKPELIIWDPITSKYSFNWEVERSQYKDKLLEGTNVIEINNLVKQKNKNLRRDKVIKSAIGGEDVRGVKKFNLAIQMIRDGKTDEEIFKKTKVAFIDISILREKIVEHNNQPKLF